MENNTGKTTESRIVLPEYTNFRKEMFGGALLSWMDELGGIAALRYAKSDVATVAVKDMRFLKPIPGGSLIDLTAEVVKVGTTSLQVKLEAVLQDRVNFEEGVLAADALFVYVAIDENKQPVKVEKK